MEVSAGVEELGWDGEAGCYGGMGGLVGGRGGERGGRGECEEALEGRVVALRGGGVSWRFWAGEDREQDRDGDVDVNVDVERRRDEGARALA